MLDECKNLIWEIIVDGNSTDNTKTIAEAYGIKFISQNKKGWGSAVKEGIDLTTLPFVTYMDGDGSYNPKALLEMRSLIDSNDAVFCSRYKDGAKSPDDTPIRAREMNLHHNCKNIIWSQNFGLIILPDV